MSGDYTRFTFNELKRHSAVRMQQGRVQLDSDWNEEVDILKRRITTTSLDVFGPVGIPYSVSPNAFKLGYVAGPNPDLSIEPGRIYVDGIQIEAFASEAASYLNQPFFPMPPPLPVTGDAVAYLDVWDREVTYIEDPSLLDVALGGADTTTRIQAVWQLRVEERQAAACGMPVGKAPSAGRMTTQALAPPAPDDPCILPPVSGYRGLENRLYRIEIQTGGPLGTAKFKWSRDNGSIVSAVRDIAVSGAQTTLTVNRIGRDQFMRFFVGDWVTVTDDFRELNGEAGEMAQVLNVDEAKRQIVLERKLPAGAGRPFGANATQIAARHTRIQKWNERIPQNAIDGDGLMTTAAGSIAIEDGIEILFSMNPAGGEFNVGDYWVFWARTATAEIEILTAAPPRGIIHHYLQLAAISGLGGPTPIVTDCRPPPPTIKQQAGDCCCTIIVKPGEDIQKGIDALPPAGGCVCLKTGLHLIRQPLRIARGNIVLKAESPGTIVRTEGVGPVLIVSNPTGALVSGVDVLGIAFEGVEPDKEPNFAIVLVSFANRVHISHCAMRSLKSTEFVGVFAMNTNIISVEYCEIRDVRLGIVVVNDVSGFTALGNLVLLQNHNTLALVGISQINSASPCRIIDNIVSGAAFGIVLNDQALTAAPVSFAAFSIITGNIIASPNTDASLFGGAFGAAAPAILRFIAIDCAASACTVAENKIFNLSTIAIGIRIAGSACDVSENTIISSREAIGPAGPFAILIGSVNQFGFVPIFSGSITDNSLLGTQHGIICANCTDVTITGNAIESIALRASFAISLNKSNHCSISDNLIDQALSAIFLFGGKRNSITANQCTLGGSGILLLAEIGPEVSNNRVDRMALPGLAAALIVERLGISNNRFTSCGLNMGALSFAVGTYGIFGEVHISGNEVRDTGIVDGKPGPSKRDIGIFGDLVMEARVSDNLVTYTDQLGRDRNREDRALLMRGFIEFAAGGNGLVLGYSIQIHGNKFVGVGLTALVELQEAKISDSLLVRFERVSFNNNYCSHLTSADANQLQATVWLVGRHGIVMSNHIKSFTRRIPSVNYNNMSGPCLGNVLSDNVINRSLVPPLDADFNMIA